LPLLQRALEENTGKVKIVFKQYPLSMHKMARKSAAASLAANKQGKFWEYHDKLFENAESLSDTKLREIASEIGLDMQTFEIDLADPDFQRVITEDMSNGRQAGVRGVPVVYINGKRLLSRTGPALQEMIDAETAKQRDAESQKAGPPETP
jgi:protein-disulfide isomerase